MIIPIEINMQHTVSEVVCLRCLRRWICVRPSTVQLKEIECVCRNVGFVIETGQDLYSKGGNIYDEKL